MENIRRVLLCGKSLFISGLQATLEGAPGLDLQVVDPQPEHILEWIIEWKPDVLILEIGLLKKAFSLALLEEFPSLKLIGVDIEDNRLLVFSGQVSYQPTTGDLLQVIEGTDRHDGAALSTAGKGETRKKTMSEPSEEKDARNRKP